MSSIIKPPVSNADAKLAKQYQKKTAREHILDAPDTYIGSVELGETENWVFNEENNKMEFQKGDWIPGLYKLFDEGNEIIIFTARGSTTNIDWTKQTENQLSEWNVKYHKLLLGKPYADIYIDDKGHNSDSWFDNE